MRIISLELENIKSYKRARVDFTPGLNAICGLNGSGKTTVLEAIGYALFDYLPYNQQAFVREGDKTGTIRVRLLAKDERQYEVVRKIGAGAMYYVADLDSGLNLAQRSENVQDWIGTQALGIESGTELKAIFKDAVGVPQGMMTLDFKTTSAQRKAVFDPLLRVEEYRDAFETLRDTVTYVKDLSIVKREDIARLETEMECLPRLEDEKDSLGQRIAFCRNSLQGLLTRQSQLNEQKQRFDEMAQSLQSVKSELEARLGDITRHRETLSHQESRVEAARLAELSTKESLPGYESVLRARQRLVELEQQRKERDSLQGQMMEAQPIQREVGARIEGLERQIKDAIEGTVRAGNLADPSRRQEELEGKLQEVAGQLRDAGKLEEQVVKLRADVEEIQCLEQSSLVRLSEARLSKQQVEQLTGAPDQLRDLRQRLAEIKHMKNQSESIRSQGSDLRKQQATLVSGVEASEALRQQLVQLRPLVEDLSELAQRLQVLRDERIHVTATMDYQAVAKADLERLHCPLLEVKCPVASGDVGVLSRFESRVDGMSQRLAEIDAELQSLEPRWVAAESAQKQIQALEIEAAKLEGTQSQLAEIEKRIEDLLREHERISEALREEPELLGREQDLQGQDERLKKEMASAAEIDVLQEQRERDRVTLQKRQDELRLLENEGGQIAGLQRQKVAVDDELHELGDPRAEQKHLLALAERQPVLEENRERELGMLSDAQERMVGLQQRLQAFHSLNEEIDEQRRIELEKCEDYERFLSNRDEAGQFAERQEALMTARQAVERAEIAERESRSKEELLGVEYDIQQHKDLSQQYEQIGKETASRQTDLEHWTKALEVVEGDLERLALLGHKLLAIESELDGLRGIGQAVDFIRDTIRSAGPAITETLLTNISRMANDIYTEIMDDHSTELRWERDYEVVVQHGPEVRKFSQLSGGEQMSAALAVRLALLKEMSEVDFVFFDEPTQNMDSERRTNLADQIRAVRGFEQFVVISHDDTFEHHTDNLIRLRKIHEETEVEVA